MKKILTLLLTTIILISCTYDSKHSETYESGEYKSLPIMLNHCKGTTTIIGISKMAGRVSCASIDIIVIDSTNTMYTCAVGGDFGFQRGDTLKR